MGKRKDLTQADRILRHLMKRGAITTWLAIRDYGITRLSAKIYELRARGYEISCDWEFSKNRYGEPVHFKKYYLENRCQKTFWEKLKDLV